MRFSNAELPPFWGASVRFFVAAALFTVLMGITRAPFPRGHALTGALVFGAVNFGISYAFAYYGLQRVNAGTAAVIVATAPLFTLVLAVVHRIERFRVRPIVGALIALAGVGLVFRQELSADVGAIYLLAMLGNAIALAEALVIAKRFPRTHPITTNAVGALVGAVLLLGLSFLTGEPHALPARADAQLALLYLATIGSIGLFGLSLYVVNRWTASATSYGLVVTPLVAITLGAILRGEPISALLIVGAVIVFVGVYIGALSR